ncbi:hypothetical protein TNIN_371351 [Trichonephila inaurata madagascariensis]|uniref:Uncharacterized protein n=1 Tax=Trichonephila inaurata madagascariensis TaxID=2747483 RepID=A0A8X7CAG2_9ARAC|nr:hypothetical protein TNIN_279381 [Trichonephila inaurata madagascariensis]GFY64333.1 hypothetical protein TNIN_371351 [Trichonephila inaurata madagascariensis]
MGRSKKVFKNVKNVGVQKMKAQNVPAIISDSTETVIQSASKPKLISNISSYENMEESNEKNVLIELNLLNNDLLNFAICKNGGHSISLEDSKRVGIVYYMELCCNFCNRVSVPQLN